jgi:hypothetical protein
LEIAMKKLFRLTTLALLVGGWTLAAAALHVVRTPGHVIVVPKDRLGFQETYVDARHWTIQNVSQHPVVSARLVSLGKAPLLAYTVENPNGDVQEQLAEAIAHPQAAPPSTQPAMVQRVKDDVHAATQAVRAVFD